MLTPEERRAVFITAQKYGFEEFAKLCKLPPERLRLLLKGRYDHEAEMKVRANWKVVLETLYGEVRKR